MRVWVYAGAAAMGALAVIATAVSWPPAVATACVVLLLLGLIVVEFDTRRHLGELRQVLRRDIRSARDRTDRVATTTAELSRSLGRLGDDVDLIKSRLDTAGRDGRATRDEVRAAAVEVVAAVDRTDQAQRRTAAALADTLTELGTNDVELASSLEALAEAQRQTGSTLERRHVEADALLRMAINHIKANRPETVAQVQALFELNRALQPERPMPANQGGWAADATTVAALVHQVLQNRPALVVECGSGLSTIWLGHALKQSGTGRLVSLEHDEEWCRLSASRVRSHGLDDVVEVRYAPLEPVTAGDRRQQWYATAALAGLDGIGLLFVDGPPAATGDDARWPAFPLLADRLSDQSVVVLDDTVRKEERIIVRDWTTDPALRVEEDLAGRATLMSYDRHRGGGPGASESGDSAPADD